MVFAETEFGAGNMSSLDTWKRPESRRTRSEAACPGARVAAEASRPPRPARWFDSEGMDTAGELTIRRLEKENSNKPNQSRASDVARKEPCRNSFSTCLCVPWRPSVPCSLFTFVFLYSLNPRRGGSRARQNCGQGPGGGARSAARPGGRHAGPGRVSSSSGRFPQRVGSSARARDRLLAGLTAPRQDGRALPGAGGAGAGCATSWRGVPGARHSRRGQSWGRRYNCPLESAGLSAAPEK